MSMHPAETSAAPDQPGVDQSPIDRADRSTGSPAFAHVLRRLYLVRFIVAAVWVAVMFVVAPAIAGPTPVLTLLLVVYPAFDAGAVVWQMRADPDRRRSRVAERLNVIISIAVAIALGVSSAMAIPAALVVWGVWAIIVGVPQLIAAIGNRRNGGQVAQMLSGGISVVAGVGFVLQGLQGSDMITGVAGYAGLGAIFFLVSAIRLTAMRRKRQE